MTKPDVYPMHRSPRCKARSKRSGLPCRNPAVRGWKVCRMHGARGGAKPGKAHPNYRHGARSKEAVALRAVVAELTRAGRKVMTRLMND